MKVKIKETKEEKKSKPFKLVITVESEDDLIVLWKRFNLCGNYVDEGQHGDFSRYLTPSNFLTWKLLDDACKKFNLKG